MIEKVTNLSADIFNLKILNLTKKNFDIFIHYFYEYTDFSTKFPGFCDVTLSVAKLH